MKVAIDGLLLRGDFAGVEHAVAQLVRHLAARAELSCTLFAPAGTAARFADVARLKFRACNLPPGGRLARCLWQQAALPAAVRRTGAALLHAPGYVSALRSPVPVVLSVYDTIAMQFPRLCRPANALHYRVMLPLAARRAARVIVPSACTARDVQRDLGVAPDRLRVIPLGVRPVFHAEPAARPPRPPPCLEAAGVTGPYLLFVGQQEPKKNLDRLVEAFHLLKTGARLPHQLVIAGKRGWGWRPAARRVRELGLDGHVRFSGYLSDEQLAAVYRQADLLLFPSLYEGFGLPALEAMACGLPVLCSDRGALPEITADAARRVDPTDTAALAAAARELLEHPEQRTGLAARGRRRAARYTWERTAAATEACYREIATP